MKHLVLSRLVVALFGAVNGCGSSSDENDQEQWIHPNHQDYLAAGIKNKALYLEYEDWFANKQTGADNKYKALKESLDWIKGKIEAENGHAPSAIGQTRTITYQFGYDPTNPCDCIFIENWKPHIFDEEISLGQNIHFLNLGDISNVSHHPGSRGGFILNLSTYNSSFLIEISNMEGEHGFLNNLQIVFNGQIDPDRIVEAFQDASRICGAKKEKY